MKRTLIAGFIQVSFFFSLAQGNVNKWEHFRTSVQESSPYFLCDEKEIPAGFTIVRRLDEQSAIVLLDRHAPGPAHQLLPVNDDWKLNIRKLPLGRRADFYLKTRGEVSFEQYDGVQVRGAFQNSYLISCAPSMIDQLKHDPNIIHISNESTDPTPESKVLDMNLNPNRINKIHHHYPQLDGTGEVVSIQENQFRETDIDLVGRKVMSMLASETVDNHATEMATIIAGAGNSFITGRGVARNAQITSSDFAEVFPDPNESFGSMGINVQNHSYGTQIESFYGVQAEAFDRSASDIPSLLHVFSSGNQGQEASTEGTYGGIEGFANLTGNFKMAKNVLVVGSVDTVGREVSFASRGPAYDGRVKPELVAYSVAGSSNSAALVSGAAILLQQFYKTQYNAEAPSALIKALLVNGAADVGPAGLDYVTGYGSVDSYESLKTLENGRFFLGSSQTGEMEDLSISLPPNAINLKVTLCWTDIPSDVGSFKALVNDLDLKVAQGGEEVLPWVLKEQADQLGSPATRGADQLNNIEQVTIENPDGDYLITVSGFQVQGTQDYAVAYDYELSDTFEWDYPTASDNMPFNGETGSYFRWKSSLADAAGTLSYSVDNGITWIVLDDAVDLATGHWRWTEIPSLNTEVIARISTGSQTFLTDPFTISRPLDVSVGFNCADSVRLQWESLAEVESYDVYIMGTQNLQFFKTTTDSALVLQNASELPDTRFSVVPRLANDKELISSLTLDYTQQAIECFVFSFFQEAVLDTGIYLNLRLGTSYGVSQLTFERQEGSEFVMVDQVRPVNTDEYRVLDDQPNQGNNVHRVVIDFENGERLIQEAGNIFYLTEVPLFIFPNPILAGGSFRIITKPLESPQPVVKIFDTKGAEVLSYPLQSEDDVIPVNQLRSGVYLYRLEDGQSAYAGKLIIQ